MHLGLLILMALWASLSLATIFGCRRLLYRKMRRTRLKELYRKVEVAYVVCAGLFGVIVLNVFLIQDHFTLTDYFPGIVLFTFSCLSVAVMVFNHRLQRTDQKWTKPA
jgi:cytochrome bd-type quinol oxidase subunit 2